LFQDESDESVEDEAEKEAEKEEELGSEEGEILDSDDELAIVNIKIADPNPQREKMNSRYYNFLDYHDYCFMIIMNQTILSLGNNNLWS
jgi:hypothetical protein